MREKEKCFAQYVEEFLIETHSERNNLNVYKTLGPGIQKDRDLDKTTLYCRLIICK